jgi:hypothetical protein
MCGSVLFASYAGGRIASDQAALLGSEWQEIFRNRIANLNQ